MFHSKLFQPKSEMMMKKDGYQIESSFTQVLLEKKTKEPSLTFTHNNLRTGSGGKEQGEDGENCQDDDLSDADEDESDLDMAWKMLDITRAITDKHSTDTMEKVDILCALAEISLERGDIESSLSDYKTALSILERLVEPDSGHIAELNFRICICLETGYQPKEAIQYCQKAMLICKARMERLTNEIKGPSGSATSSTVSEIDEGIQQSSNVPYIDKFSSDKEAEIGVKHYSFIDMRFSISSLCRSQLTQVIVNSQMGKMRLYLCRYIMQITAHSLWRERKRRKHGEDPQNTQSIIRFID